MKSLHEFIPLNVLIHSENNLPRQYFLYWRAARSGTPGSIRRYHWFCDRHGRQKIDRIKSLFRLP